MTIKSFPHGIPFSSSFAISASYVPSASFIGPTASLAEFVTGFVGPSGSVGTTIDNSGQFTIVPSESIEFVGAAYNVSGEVTFPTHQIGDFIIVFGSSDAYFAPILSSGATANGWITAGYTAGPSTIVFYKYATSNTEPYPEFAQNPPTRTHCLVYRNVDNAVGGGQSTGGNTVSAVTYPAVLSGQFTPYRSHWIMYYVFGYGSSIPLRPGFVTRLNAPSGDGGNVLFSDSNNITGSIAGIAIGVSPNISFNARSIILRAKLDYSQFED